MNEAGAMTTGFMIMFVCAGVLISGMSVPLILRRVKPNRWYGFRTPRTLSDDRMWYEANAYSGRLSLGLGAILVFGSAGLRFVPGIGTSVATYCTVCTVLFTVGLLAVVALSFRHLEGL
jgi:uncharacterized membrane protein